jgi:hypothetical protein
MTEAQKRIQKPAYSTVSGFRSVISVPSERCFSNVDEFN